MKTTVQQKGITFTGFIMIAIFFVVVAIFTMKLIPVYMDNGKIQKAFDSMIKDPALQGATRDEIKLAFFNRTKIDSIDSLNEENINIYIEGGKFTISAKYNVKIPLAGNVSLLIEFNPSAPK